MTFKELIVRNIDAIDLIIDSLLDSYPDEEDNIDGYHHVFIQLQEIEPKKNTENLVINITEVEEEFGDVYEKYHYVGAYIKHNSNETYAIEFNLWSEWLGYEVDEEALQLYGEFEFIAHCLWEMTFMGFTEEEIEKKRKILKLRIEEIESGEATLIPWEEVKKELNMLEDD